MKYLATIMFAFGLSFFASHGVQAGGPSTVCPKFWTGLCKAAHSDRTGPSEYEGPLVCVTFMQKQVGVVVVRFFDANDNELDAGDLYHARGAGIVDRFCTGRHWWEKAAKVVFCDDLGRTLGAHAILRPPAITYVLANNGTAPGDFVCLKGADWCERHKHDKLYPTG
jgi:hypothetical protein